MNDTIVVFICTGKDYLKFLQPAIDGVHKFIKWADILLFTDSELEYDVTKQVYLKHLGWPDVTLLRYHTMLSEKEFINSYQNVLYIDQDMKICKLIEKDIFKKDIIVAIHSGFMGWVGYPDPNPKSTAYLPENKVKTYVSGAVQGGKVQAFLEMAELLKNNIDIDLSNNYRARWLDESHLNRFVADNPEKVFVLPPTFHWYEQPESIICRINKNWQLPESSDWKTHIFDPEIDTLMKNLQI